jgi:hypothetical protein
MQSRRHFCRILASGAAAAIASRPALQAAADLLPLQTTFRGREKFDAIVAKAAKENWSSLPVGHRMAMIGLEMRGTPYAGYTLEIDDRVECPSANFNGVDCWTFFEISLCLARLMEPARSGLSVQQLLAEIEWTRYRGGKCSGGYLERIHYLNEWFVDNEARGTVKDVTHEIGSTARLAGRQSTEMTHLWKSYRYLKKNPSLLTGMAEVERKVSALPVHYLPNAGVKAAESKLRNGDILGIVTKGDGGVCSHVGLCVKFKDGVARIMHASSNFRKVVVEDTVSNYLHTYKSHIGLMVARPLPVASTVRNPESYKSNLAKLIKG